MRTELMKLLQKIEMQNWGLNMGEWSKRMTFQLDQRTKSNGKRYSLNVEHSSPNNTGLNQRTTSKNHSQWQQIWTVCG